MDKQMIEEMAKVVQRDMCGDIPCEECNYHGKMKILPRYCGTYLIVETLYNAGYRKIPKNAVVLTREEYDDDTVKKVARKETAEKFAKSIEDLLKQPYEGKTEKQYWQRKGMEEGLKMALEICKEITEGV